ncbi:MAG TPA: RidA family protein [Myxococcota bacterium]|nr:RidA family protein [Myxococcota bacterium]
MHRVVESKDAPKAVGPYSQAIIAEGSKLIFVSGQIPLDPSTMQISSHDVRNQTAMVLKNLHAVLRAADVHINQVVKTTVYIKNMNDFAVINEEYERFFGTHKPARACVEVARLPRDVLVEIDAIAMA